MANLETIVCTWSGFTGAPGYTKLVFSAGQASTMQPKVVTFWTAILPYLPTAVSITTPSNGEVIDETTGKMVNVWAGGTGSTLNGSGGSSFSSVSGGLIRWDTGQFSNGRKVRGRTFLVPLVAGSYATGGVLVSATANAIKAAADVLLTPAGSLMCWSRPVYDNSTAPPTLKKAGKGFAITTSTVPTKVTYLSSRRD